MVAVKIYGFSGSTCTRRVAQICKEVGVEYQLISIDSKAGEQKSAAHLARQPFGVVPVLEEEDGFQVYESRAIARYLVLKYGANSKLIPGPEDLKAVAKFETAASIEQNNFEPYVSVTAAQLIFNKFKGLPYDEALGNASFDKLKEKLKVYETILSKQKYLAGDEVTLADLFHLPYGYTLTKALKDDFLTATPNLARWWNDISARPSWQAVKDGA